MTATRHVEERQPWYTPNLKVPNCDRLSQAVQAIPSLLRQRCCWKHNLTKFQIEQFRTLEELQLIKIGLLHLNGICQICVILTNRSPEID